jgi:RHS repeat-associated protein
VYDATGQKLAKTVTSSNWTYKQEYFGGIEYKDGSAQRIAHSEGSVVKAASGVWQYEYVLRDHLGNTRVTFQDGESKGLPYLDWETWEMVDPNVGNVGYNDGIVTAADIKQINHFYPFGLNMEGNWNGAAGNNKYQYNEKEWNDDFGLGLNDYGARFYDPAAARWTSVDPLAEEYQRWSPYHYAKNNPIRYIDPNGMESKENCNCIDVWQEKQALKLVWLSMNMMSSTTMCQQCDNAFSKTAFQNPLGGPTVAIFANSPAQTNPYPAKVVQGDAKTALGFTNRMTDKIQAQLLEMIQRSKLDMSQTSVDAFIEYVLNNARTFDFKAEDGSGHVGHISGIEAYYLPENPTGTLRWTDPKHPSLIKPYNVPLNRLFSGGQLTGALEIRNPMSSEGVSLSVERSHSGVITGNGYRIAFLITITAGLEQ